MTVQINISQTSSGFATEVPPELHKSFKSAFRSAKFDERNNVWFTKPQTRDRLTFWKKAADEVVAKVSTATDFRQDYFGLIAAIAEIKQSEAKADRDIGVVTKKLAELRDERSKLAKVEAATARKREEIAHLSASVAAEQRAADTERAALTDRLSEIIDLLEVAAATAKMRQNHFPRGRQQFDAGLAVIKKARIRLAEAGLGSRALDYLADINFNRPDRDRVERAGDFITRIYEIEDSEAD